MLITWLPVEEHDLTVGPTLFTDSRVLAVAAGHELAGRPTAPLESLADFAHVNVPDVPASWENGYLPFWTPHGRPIERIQSVASTDELIQLVGTGEIVHAFPAHVTHYWSLSDIRWLPIPDLNTLTYVLVWRPEAESDAIRAFARTVKDLAAAGPPRGR